MYTHHDQQKKKPKKIPFEQTTALQVEGTTRHTEVSSMGTALQVCPTIVQCQRQHAPWRPHSNAKECSYSCVRRGSPTPGAWGRGGVKRLPQQHGGINMVQKHRITHRLRVFVAHVLIHRLYYIKGGLGRGRLGQYRAWWVGSVDAKAGTSTDRPFQSLSETFSSTNLRYSSIGEPFHTTASADIKKGQKSKTHDNN